jgi:hypothetical protein
MLLDATALAPATPTLPTSVATAMFAAYALDYLKRLKQIPAVSYYSTRLNTVLRMFLSGIGTLGVSWAWSAAGTGHQLLITIPAWSAIANGLWTWGASYCVQHFAEIQLAQRPVAQAAIREQHAESPAAMEVKPVAVPVAKE